MKKNSITQTLFLSVVFLALIKTDDLLYLKKFYKHPPSIQFNFIKEKRKSLSKDELRYFSLWASILTGNSRSINKDLKKKYEDLALWHIFTPSGFHLSAILFPVNQIFRHQFIKITCLLLITIFIFWLPGLAAFKRMIGVKFLQFFLTQKTGFYLAFFFDFMFGTFKTSPLSFTYSFLFLSIIYSGAKFIKLTCLFFLAQTLLAFFFGQQVSPLLFIWNPLLNFLITLFMPFLFLLSFPMAEWQLKSGLFLIEKFDQLVTITHSSTKVIPCWEIHIFFFLLIGSFILKKFKISLLIFLFYSNSLNNQPSQKIRTYRYELANDESFNCGREYLRGHWNFSCSQIKRSRKKQN
jgi:hypothetical protein